jgi:hypothetical protein
MVLLFIAECLENMFSMIPLLSQIFAGMAIFLLGQTEPPWIPVWSPLLIGFSDPALWRVDS